jgi:hypothetical protein
MRGASGIIFHHSRSFFISVRRRSDATTLKKSTIRPVYNSGKYATSHQPAAAAQPPHPFTSRCRAENLPLQKFTLSFSLFECWIMRAYAHTHQKGKLVLFQSQAYLTCTAIVVVIIIIIFVVPGSRHSSIYFAGVACFQFRGVDQRTLFGTFILAQKREFNG